MNKKDKKMLIDQYKALFKQYGNEPKALGWGKVPQEARFKALTYPLLTNLTGSILDVGCGFSDFYGYLKNIGWNGKYTGLEIVPEFIEISRQKFRGIDIRNIDIINDTFTETYDTVYACGIFNDRLPNTDQIQYIEKMLRKMFSLCKIGVAVDFLSDLVDYKHDIAFHVSCEDIIALIKQISRRFLVKHDYLPYEFSICLFKNQNITSDYRFNVFS